MRITIHTKVEQSLEAVIEGFNESLFLKLNPPFPPVKLLQFDGCKTNDRVKLQLNFIAFKQIWESLITADQQTKDQFYFIDEGIQLPFFLKTWKHKHVIKKEGNATVITDDIQFTTPFIVLNWLMYPALFLQFQYRKPHL